MNLLSGSGEKPAVRSSPLASSARSFFIVRTGVLEELDDQAVVADRRGVEVLDRPSLRSSVCQRDGPALVEDFDVIADVADRKTKGFRNLDGAAGLVDLVEQPQYAATQRGFDRGDAILCFRTRYTRSGEPTIWLCSIAFPRPSHKAPLAGNAGPASTF
jgi:hypothetical protein